MKKYLSALLCVMMIFSMPFTAYADIGPKPSVRITFEGVENAVYYGTLLSERESTGPASAWNGNEAYASYPDGEKDIWQAFVNYTDTDGFYYLQEHWNCTDTNQLNWTYYPPSTFKILLYFPDTDTYYVSDIYERYAFDSYYTVDLSDMAVSATDNAVNNMPRAEKSYNFTWEIISLAARVAATIAIELIVAFIFFYREKTALKFIAAVNIITQIALNVALNVINYSKGSMAFVFWFVILEVAVFAVEAVIYAAMLNRLSQKPAKKGKSTAYAFAANVASFAIGLWISRIVPGIF